MLSLWDSKVEPWDLKDKKYIYYRDVILNEASMWKTFSSQYLENKTIRYCSKWNLIQLRTTGRFYIREELNFEGDTKS